MGGRGGGLGGGIGTDHSALHHRGSWFGIDSFEITLIAQQLSVENRNEMSFRPPDASSDDR